MNDKTAQSTRAWFEIIALVFGLASPVVATATTLAVNHALNGERINMLQTSAAESKAAIEALRAKQDERWERVLEKLDGIGSRLATIEQAIRK